jgi:hypothetical protein
LQSFLFYTSTALSIKKKRISTTIGASESTLS